MHGVICLLCHDVGSYAHPPHLPERPAEKYDSRSLYEQLQAEEQRKQEEFDAKYALSMCG